jgi:hypothetical protein
MYNLNSHYENILNLANSIIAGSKVVYLHPFGATQPENIESIGSGDGNGMLILAYDQEPLDCYYNSYLIDNMLDTFRDAEGEHRRMFILLNTEKHSYEKDQLASKYIFNDCNYFFHALCASDWYRGYKFDAKITPINERKLTKKFISFNRITGNNRVYRSLLLSELVDVVDQGYISYSDCCPVHNEFYVDAIYNARKKHKLDHLYIDKAIQRLNSLTKQYPLRIDNLDEQQIPNGSHTLGPMSELMSSFLHVVTETMFWDQRTHLTEKIFKPIVAKQPFVLAGCQNNLEYLRSYGFKTFGQWWDEGYDSIADPVARLTAVSNIVKDICNRPITELEEMLQDMTPVLEHNANWFYNTQFTEMVWEELKTNLSNCLWDYQVLHPKWWEDKSTWLGDVKPIPVLNENK